LTFVPVLIGLVRAVAAVSVGVTAWRNRNQW
jgi:hypothetical protein